MDKNQIPKYYDLEERTLKFAQDIIAYCRKLPRTLENIEIAKQLIRAGGSVGANYLEANESLSKKDFSMRAKICRKEAKESRYWLILSIPIPEQEEEKQRLINEAYELTKIFGSIVAKSR